MTTYRQDRGFTDYVHKHLAEPLIYSPLNWSTAPFDAEELERMDMHEGVDYLMRVESGDVVGVQERFRDKDYAKYSDATLRYRRDGNKHAERRKSEFYKIIARYLVYGITNGSKRKDKREELSEFLKWVILDLEALRTKFQQKLMVIDGQSGLKHSKCADGKLYCPVMFNRDGSSSFVVVDVPLLHDLWGMECIFAQKGFLE